MQNAESTPGSSETTQSGLPFFGQGIFLGVFTGPPKLSLRTGLPGQELQSLADPHPLKWAYQGAVLPHVPVVLEVPPAQVGLTGQRDEAGRGAPEVDPSRVVRPVEQVAAD